MHKVKEVTVFSIGDSRKLQSWSNVPFFFTETLIAKGVRVNRIDINRTIVGKVLNKTIWRAFNKINRNTYYDYSRSLFHHLLLRLKIKSALTRHPSAEVNIFLTFSASSAGLDDRPTVLFCDWTYDHHFRYFEEKPPNAAELASMAREDRQIEGADLVLVLFPGIAAYMKGRYRNPNIFYLGNVVNTVAEVSGDEILQRKAGSFEILFVGGKKYLEGARRLIETYQSLKARYPQLVLNIVGMTAADFALLPSGVRCHGYLDKDDPAQRNRYYALLMGSKVLVNTTPKWGAFSATLEAMHLYTPIIITPYAEFVETFGRDISFGHYCDLLSVDELASKIVDVLECRSYELMCVRAHDAVKGFTWDAYMEKVLDKLDTLLVRS